MRIDLHCHSSISDGLLPPRDLVARAAANGVELLALTDHDDLSGLAEARAAATERGLAFFDGVEISATWQDHTVHVVGIGIDPDDEALQAGLAGLRAGRDARAARIAEGLAAIGFDGALDGARRYAQSARIIGRAHFARFLVERRAAPDVRSVFDHYLVRGKPGFVPHRWMEVDQAVAIIRGAGGTPVLAHPGRYRIGKAALQRLLDAFKDAGGDAIEVVSGVHSEDDVRRFAQLARRYGFMASRGSDFHGPGESYADIGSTAELPDGLVPVWQRLRA